MNQYFFTIPFYFWIFVLGLVIGSFLNVVIYRTEKERSLRGRSCCPKCKKKIIWKDNIPVVSFVKLKGRCRNCKEPISWQYPAVEILTAVLFTFSAYLLFHNFWNDWLHHYFTVAGMGILWMKLWQSFYLENVRLIARLLELLFLFSILSVFTVISIYDLKHLLIPNSFIVFGLVAVLAFNILSDSLSLSTVYQPTNHNVIVKTKELSEKSRPFSLSLTSYFIPYQKNDFWLDTLKTKTAFLEMKLSKNSSGIFSLTFLKKNISNLIYFFAHSRTGSGLIAGLTVSMIFYLIVFFSKEKWMGMGDVKLVLLLGLLLGGVKTILAVFLAFQIGALAGIILLILKRATAKTALPFGPFLILGSLLAMILS